MTRERYSGNQASEGFIRWGLDPRPFPLPLPTPEPTTEAAEERSSRYTCENSERPGFPLKGAVTADLFTEVGRDRETSFIVSSSAHPTETIVGTVTGASPANVRGHEAPPLQRTCWSGGMTNSWEGTTSLPLNQTDTGPASKADRYERSIGLEASTVEQHPSIGL